jgi:hypothetical protein
MKGDWQMKLTILLPSVNQLYRKCGTFNASQTVWGPMACYRNNFTFFIIIIIIVGVVVVTLSGKCE